MDIKFETGLEPINLIFSDRGENETIFFNPCDPNMLTRIQTSSLRIDKAISNFRGSLVNDADNAKAVSCLNQIVFDEVDFIFDSKISDKVFLHCSPFALDKNGVTYIERFINAVTPVIKKAVSVARKKREERMLKHTEKYTK